MKIKRKERTLGRFAGAGRRLQSVPKDSVVGCVKPVQREPGISWGWREAGCLCDDFFLIFTSDMWWVRCSRVVMRQNWTFMGVVMLNNSHCKQPLLCPVSDHLERIASWSCIFTFFFSAGYLYVWEQSSLEIHFHFKKKKNLKTSKGVNCIFLKNPYVII